MGTAISAVIVGGGIYLLGKVRICFTVCKHLLPFSTQGVRAVGLVLMAVSLKFPNCLCGISTRQLELLLWRAGPTAEHTQDSPIFFIQLNYVYNRKE